jgi:hypothetical protein
LVTILKLFSLLCSALAGWLRGLWKGTKTSFALQFLSRNVISDATNKNFIIKAESVAVFPAHVTPSRHLQADNRSIFARLISNSYLFKSMRKGRAEPEEGKLFIPHFRWQFSPTKM